MNRRQLFLLITGVVLIHAAGFWLISGTKPIPEKRFVPPPQKFVAREASWVDEHTGERMTVREYNVSTKLALPDAIMEKGREP